jgi:predicted nucleic acid-binding protein
VAGYLLDTGIISAIRVSHLSPQDWVGDPDIAAPFVVFDEAQRDLDPDSIQSVGNLEVFAQLPTLIEATPEVVALAKQLRVDYARHQPPLAVNDSIIIATAMALDRVAITKNTADFHYPRGLRWLDANGFHPAFGSLLSGRSPVDAEPSSRQCCARVT